MIILIVLIVLCVVAFAVSSRGHNSAESYHPVNTSVLPEIDRKLAILKSRNKEWSEKFTELMHYQNNGSQYEKQGDIDKAIYEYNMAVDFGMQYADIISQNNYFHSLERLMILYRKTKDYKNELRIIDIALSGELSESDRRDLEYRKERAIILKRKYGNEQKTVENH